jgi:hypothetical protein
MTIIGCGGGGGNGGGGNNGGGGGDIPSVNTALFYNGPLPRPGFVEVTYNTGQGRGTATATATLRRLVFEDQAFGLNDERNIVRTLLNPERILGLDLYTSQSVSVDVPMDGFATNFNHRLFENFQLDIQSVTLDGVEYNGPQQQSVLVDNFLLRAAAFPGRTTSISIFLHDAMFSDDGNGNLDFDRQSFEDLNYSPVESRIVGHLADYLAFDISNIPNLPLMTSGFPATTIYFSGDSFGLSDTPSLAATDFEILVPETPTPGSILGDCRLAPSFPPNSPNTYALKQVDPRSLPGNTYITAQQGTWKWWLNPDDPSQSPILNVTTFAFITFPQSQDDGRQDCAIVALNGGVITEMYFGEVNLQSGNFNAWPLTEITEGTTNGEINGTVDNYIFRSNGGFSVRDVRGGSFEITAGDPPAEFPTTGSFIVYRL